MVLEIVIYPYIYIHIYPYISIYQYTHVQNQKTIHKTIRTIGGVKKQKIMAIVHILFNEPEQGYADIMTKHPENEETRRV